MKFCEYGSRYVPYKYVANVRFKHKCSFFLFLLTFFFTDVTGRERSRSKLGGSADKAAPAADVDGNVRLPCQLHGTTTCHIHCIAAVAQAVNIKVNKSCHFNGVNSFVVRSL